MKCPKCGGRTYVTNTIEKDSFVRRYRKCKKCSYTFKTKEMTHKGWKYRKIVEEIQQLVENK